MIGQRRLQVEGEPSAQAAARRRRDARTQRRVHDSFVEPNHPATHSYHTFLLSVWECLMVRSTEDVFRVSYVIYLPALFKIDFI